MPNIIENNRVTAIIETDLGTVILKDVNNEKYELPGGQIKQNETPEHALERELKEELGALKIVNKQYLFNTTTVHNTKHKTIKTNHYVYLLKAEGEIELIERYNPRTNTKVYNTFKTDCREVINGGFFNAKYIDTPDLERYQGHVYNVLNKYVNNGYKNKYQNNFFSKNVKLTKKD